MKRKIFLLFPVLLASCGGGPIPMDYSNAVNVFVLSGQSNAEGQSLNANLKGYFKDAGLPEDLYEVGFEDVKMSYMGKENSSNKISPISGELVTAKLGFGASPSRFGPDLPFAEAIHNNAKPGDRPTFIIKYTYSGAGFLGEKNFRSPSSGETGDLYAEMIQFIDNSMELITKLGYTPIIKGLFWIQGEGDGYSQAGAGSYEKNMKWFLSDIRDYCKDYAIDFDGNNISFIDATISLDSIWDYAKSINNTKRKISQLSNNNFLIDTLETGLDLKLGDEEHGGGDAYHYTVDSTIRLGHEIARIVIENKMLEFE